MEYQSTANSGHLAGVDVLRGLSIIAVVLLHISIFAHRDHIDVGAGLPLWLHYLVFWNGDNGVSVFFVVSGFLITLISIRRFGSLDGIRIRRFYRIRFARIAPPLLLLLVILSALHLAGVHYFRIRPQVTDLFGALFSALTFNLNWLEAVRGWLPPCWTVLWSLSVEEVFYLAFPVVCVLLWPRRFGRIGFFALLFGLIVVAPFARTEAAANLIWRDQSYFANFDGIAVGCLCALLTEWCLRRHVLQHSYWPLVAQSAGVLLMLFIAVWPWPAVIAGWHVKRALAHGGTDVTLLIVGTALVIWGSVLRGAGGTAWLGPLRWFGRHSYEIYLTHEFFVIAFLTVLPRGPVLVWIVAVLAASSGTGALLAKLFSDPMNRALRGGTAPVSALLAIAAPDALPLTDAAQTDS